MKTETPIERRTMSDQVPTSDAARPGQPGSLSDQVHAELEKVALQHPRFETFLQDVERVAQRVWHKVRTDGTHVLAQDGAEAVSELETAAKNDLAAAQPADQPVSSTPEAVTPASK